MESLVSYMHLISHINQTGCGHILLQTSAGLWRVSQRCSSFRWVSEIYQIGWSDSSAGLSGWSARPWYCRKNWTWCRVCFLQNTKPCGLFNSLQVLLKYLTACLLQSFLFSAPFQDSTVGETPLLEAGSSRSVVDALQKNTRILFIIIQAFCHVIQREAHSRDILSILTR